MPSLSRSTQTTNPTLESDPETWPDWTDNWHWEADPLPSDAEWAVREFNGDEDLDETAAVEAAALASIEMGLIPADLALAINRTSLAGSADAILHEGSLPSQCPCLPCTMDRTRRFAE